MAEKNKSYLDFSDSVINLATTEEHGEEHHDEVHGSNDNHHD